MMKGTARRRENGHPRIPPIAKQRVALNAVLFPSASDEAGLSAYDIARRVVYNENEDGRKAANEKKKKNGRMSDRDGGVF
jgi:hypothetical protein